MTQWHAMDQWPRLTDNPNKAKLDIQSIRDDLLKVDFNHVPSLQGAQQDFVAYVNALLVPTIRDFLELVQDIDNDSVWLSSTRAVTVHDFVAMPLREAWTIVEKYEPDSSVGNARDIAINGLFVSERSVSNQLGIRPYLTIALPFLQTFLAYKRAADDSDAIDRFSKTSAECAALGARSNAIFEKAERALKAAEEAAMQRIVTREAEVFDKTSRHHAVSARWWLCASIGLALVVVGSGIWMMNNGAGPPDPRLSWTLAANLAHFAVRALCISILSFGLVASLRNYRAEKHNQVTNEHRSSALATYRQFKAGAEGRVADAVTLQAMEAVFAPQATGYAANDVTGGTHLTELLDAITPRKSKVDASGALK
jgi:hypothetical protein